MTEDYKTKIFNFLAGHYNIEQPANNEPYYLLESSANITLLTQMKSYFGGTASFSITGSIQSGTIDNEGYEYQVVWGTVDTGSISNFIMVVDDNYNVVNLFTEYSSGTALQEILDIQIAEDGTFYAIERVNGSSYRYAQYNNFCLPYNDEYILKLRDSANISSANLTISGTSCIPQKIKKAFGDAIYGITIQGGSANNTKIGTLFLTIEGGSNTWVQCPCSQVQNSGNIEDTYVITLTDSDDETYGSIRVLYKNDATGSIGLFEGTSIGGTLNYITSNTGRGSEQAKAMFINYTTAYIVSESVSGNDGTIYLDAFVGDDFISYSSYPISLTAGNTAILSLKLNKGNLFLFMQCPLLNNKYANLYVGRIWNNQIFYQEFMGTPGILNINYGFNEGFYFVSSNFNLCKIGMVAFGTTSTIPPTDIQNVCYLTQVFNEDNYNGVVPYQDLSSLTPTQGIFENTNGDILFARNVYSNVYSGGNKIISSIQVPSRYLNGIDVDVNRLYGYTNNEIVDENRTWNKTQYENVYINFINYYQVVDNTQANTKYMTNASNGVSNYIYDNENGYGKIEVAKYRNNYEDETSSIHYLTLNYDGVNEVLEIQFSFYQDENHKVNSIDILSNDETITYINIDTSSYEVNKVHNISINMHVE